MITPLVADMAHFNPVNFTLIKAAGILGVIHKATQGVGVTDDQYARRRAAAAAVGLKWGAYSFATGDDARAHARHFLEVAAPDADTLCCLDFEDNARSPMSGQQALVFMEEVEQSTGRVCWIYGGNRIFEHLSPLARATPKIADYLHARPLWLCQYKTGLPAGIDLAELKKHIRVPAPWSDFTLLQYTGDGVGPLPHTVSGLENGADLNAFETMRCARCGRAPRSRRRHEGRTRRRARARTFGAGRRCGGNPRPRLLVRGGRARRLRGTVSP
jgi:lysozyme